MISSAQNLRFVIPARDAAATLPAVLTAIRRVFADARIVVVDDGSRDDTAASARNLGTTVISHSTNKGKGAALKSGIIAACADTEVEAICTVDADGQHDPSDIPGLLEIWRTSRADLVIGRRTIAGTAMPFHRRVSNTLTSLLVTARTGVRVFDSQCGFRLMTRAVALRAMPRSDGFEAETEWIIRAALLGMRIAPAPVRTIYGNERSHMDGFNTTRAFVRVLFQEY